MRKLRHREVCPARPGHTYRRGAKITARSTLFQKVETGLAMILFTNTTHVKLEGDGLFQCVLLLACIHSVSVRWNVPERGARSDLASAADRHANSLLSENNGPPQ